MRKRCSIFERITFLEGSQDVRSLGKLEVLGKLRACRAQGEEYQFAYPAFKDLDLRQAWMEELKEVGYMLPTIVHPAATVSPSARLKEHVKKFGEEPGFF